MSMDLDAPIAIQTLPVVQQKSATILCCNCGAPIDGTSSAGALCSDCIKLTVDISQGIQREATLHVCRDCDRWLQPPNHWLVAAPESRELLALCLRKLRGLSKVRIIDASFIWTEPHSRRVKLKITIQQEAFQGTILQQTFEVEYVVAYHQCPDCKKSYTANTWRAVVQVRQKVPHKRTFLYLEQLILKHSAHRDTLNIKEVKDGLDFFYAQRNHAEKFIDFLNSVCPTRVKKAQELISVDIHTSSKSYKFSFSVELVPICKDDLVALPVKLAKSIGNIAPLTLCHRVGTAVNVMDPHTLQTAEISTPVYWRSPFVSLADVQELVEFVVLDIEPLGPSKGRFSLAEVVVARASDLGTNDVSYTTRTHLGSILHPGDSVLGYHLTGTNFNNPQFEALEQSASLASHIPDVMLVKKSYPRSKKKSKPRNWRLKRMGREESEMAPRKQDQERVERDFEMFLRDVEEDSEFRSALALYKNTNKNGGGQGAKAEKMQGLETQQEAEGAEVESSVGDGDEDEDEDAPKIAMDELLDELDDLDIADDQ
ncbi:MAG: ribosome-binding protein [Sclerophora amabilis]|nr:MAG: ribosome-binding protein [Sclerophora amabilis]